MESALVTVPLGRRRVEARNWPTSVRLQRLSIQSFSSCWGSSLPAFAGALAGRDAAGRGVPTAAKREPNRKKASNVEHPTSNIQRGTMQWGVGNWMLDVGCSMFCHRKISAKKNDPFGSESTTPAPEGVGAGSALGPALPAFDSVAATVFPAGGKVAARFDEPGGGGGVHGLPSRKRAPSVNSGGGSK